MRSLIVAAALLALAQLARVYIHEDVPEPSGITSGGLVALLAVGRYGRRKAVNQAGFLVSLLILFAYFCLFYAAARITDEIDPPSAPILDQRALE